MNRTQSRQGGRSGQMLGRETHPLAEPLGNLLGHLSKNNNELISKLTVWLYQNLDEGHVCVDLTQADSNTGLIATAPQLVHWPSLEKWKQILFSTEVVGKPGEFKPLILEEGGKLYLQRYWSYENDTSKGLLTLAGKEESGTSSERLEGVLEQVFKGEEMMETSDQFKAVRLALKRSLSLISGGPGTGKTTTIVRIIAGYLRLHDNNTRRIAICTPTGKATSRLREAISELLPEFGFQAEQIDVIISQTQTVHRLLGLRRDAAHSRFDQKNPLPADLVIVDEASMVDLSLMAKLVTSLNLARTRLVLVGDSGQLSSVDAGAVFCDFTRAVKGAEKSVSKAPSLAGSAVFLTYNFRSGPNHPIARFNRAVGRGKVDEAVSVLTEGNDNLCRLDPPPSGSEEHRGIFKRQGDGLI